MTKKDIYSALAERILLLDGGFGTMVQQQGLQEADFRGSQFVQWRCNLKGCNDLLVFTRPDVVKDIHRQYLAAGADIITTNSFNANAVSLADYGLESYAYAISKVAAEVAREVADEFSTSDCPRFVVGSMGPTTRSLSMSSDVSNPAARDVTFEQMEQAYYDQAMGLVDGGVDVLIVETVFDTLNAKAALHAISRLFEKRGVELPVMVSGTLSDASGRTLSGQTLDAFYTSVSHMKLLSIGLNCAYGARQMMPYLEQLSAVASCYISAYPNAGLPNALGGYDETPQMFADDVAEYMERGIINIIGGCCGTTPEHISELSKIVGRYTPRKVQQREVVSDLSGLERVEIRAERNLINIGERCNVAGSAKFARLIREGDYEQALSIARAQVESGAQVLDICMDDAMIDGKQAMRHFLNLVSSQPEIARLPIMVDSSKWDTLMVGLSVLQGKSIVNSISLKEGEQEFLRRARQIDMMGAVAVVMLFDEKGQADTYERKIEIAERAYNLLVNSGFAPQNIIFDPNILSVATGIEQHDGYAKAFIDATRWIKQNLPHAKITGGVSNLSFAFRGNNYLREAMHSAFLYHASKAGMDLAIVNAAMLQPYDSIDKELLELIEDVLLCRREGASHRLIEFAQNIKGEGVAQNHHKGDEWRQEPLLERVKYAMMKGNADYIEVDTMEGYNLYGEAVQVIDNLLMPAMEHIGKLFGEGKMFLPQVVNSARVMKRAVAVLTPFIEAARESGDAEHSGAGKVLIATVKGDVHDIGKNIVAVVMACNGYLVEDMGVMVESEKIVDRAVEWGAEVICLSGLITPSLEEMIGVATECERRGLSIPIIIGGATTSPLHTAVKIAPNYSGAVIHARNASDNPKILQQLLGDDSDLYLDHVRAEQMSLRSQFEREMKSRELLPLVQVREAISTYEDTPSATPKHVGRLVFPDFDIDGVEGLIDWNFFFTSWGLKGRYPEILSSEKYGEQATKLFDDAKAMLEQIKKDKSLQLQGVVALFKARRDGDDIVVTDSRKREVRLPMLRNQQRQDANLSVADFVASKDDYIGAFALSAGVGLEILATKFKDAGDDYNAMIVKLLADRLTEAFAEWVHSFVRRQMWGYESGEALTPAQIIAGDYQGLRMAFGYPATPDHSLKADIFKLLSAEATTVLKLDPHSYMINPAESLCGLILSRGNYFSVGALADNQIEDYAKRRGIDRAEVERLLPKNI